MPQNSRPPWAVRLERCRERLGLSQAALARNVGVSAMTLSRWERGMNAPRAEHWISLSKFFGPPECWQFLDQAGLTRQILRRWMNGQRNER